MVVWGHKVTNLKATHNSTYHIAPLKHVVWGHKITNLKTTHNLNQALRYACQVIWDHKVTNLKATHNYVLACYRLFTVVWGHKVTNLKATHNKPIEKPYKAPLFEVTKLRIWKQLTTMIPFGCTWFSCLRSQSYEFESNSQQVWHTSTVYSGCLRSQSYEFESNSQHKFPVIVVQPMLFEITKLQIWKQLTTGTLKKQKLITIGWPLSSAFWPLLNT